MGFMAPLAIAGMALAAGGTAYNFMEKRKTARAVKRINREARERIDANTAAATQRWGDTLNKLTPEEQERLTAEGAANRMAAFEEDTQDVPEATNVMQSTEGAPAIVKTEAAKQLGDKLAEMRGMMQARSRLGGWDDRGLATSTLLGRSRQDIGRFGNFSQGWASAAAQDAAERQAQHSPIGDIMLGAGSLMSMGAGAAGAASAAAPAAAGAATTAAGTAAPAAAGLGSWLLQSPFMQWATTPLNARPKQQPTTTQTSTRF